MEITAKEYMAMSVVQVTHEPSGMYVQEADVYRMMEGYKKNG